MFDYLFANPPRSIEAQKELARRYAGTGRPRTDVAPWPKITMIEAIAMAQAWEMAHDPSVVVLGEDVGKNGGVFRATAGLFEKFGADRVQDTPLAENMIAGMCVGMAARACGRSRKFSSWASSIRRWIRSSIT